MRTTRRLTQAGLITLATVAVRAGEPPASSPEPPASDAPADVPPPTPPPSQPWIRHDVATKLDEAREPSAGLLPLGPVSLLDAAFEDINTRLDKDLGLSFSLAYTLSFQAATSGPGDRSGGEGDLDLFAAWRLIGEKDAPNAGTLNVNAQHIHTIGEVPPASLASEIGAAWGTSDGIGESESFPVIQCYYEQWLFDDRIMIVVGKIDTTNYINTNRYADDTLYFMNRAFSSNPALNYPGNGLGAVIAGKLTESFYIGGCIADANGDETTSGFDTIDEAEFFTALEAGFTLDINDLGEGNYRLSVWHTDEASDADLPEDHGIALSLDQELGGGIVPFARLAWSDADATGIEAIIAGGLAIEGPFSREEDVLGIGASWGRPSDDSLSDQFVAEMFYRLQLAPSIQCTLGGQVIVNAVERDSGDDEAVGVFEARLRIEF